MKTLTQCAPGKFLQDHTPAEQAQLLAHYHAEALAGRPLSGNTGRHPVYLGDDHCRTAKQRAAYLALAADPATRLTWFCGDALKQDGSETGKRYSCTFRASYFDLDGVMHAASITAGGRVTFNYGPRMGEVIAAR